MRGAGDPLQVWALLASVVAGVLWGRIGPSAAFGVGAFVAALAAGLIPWIAPRRSDGPDSSVSSRHGMGHGT